MKTYFLTCFLFISFLISSFPSFGQRYSFKPYQNKVKSHSYEFVQQVDSTYKLEIKIETENTNNLAAVDFYFMKERDSNVYIFTWRVFYSQDDANIHVLTVNKVKSNYNVVYCKDFYYTNALEMKAFKLEIPTDIVQEIKLIGVNLRNDKGQKSLIQNLDEKLNKDKFNVLYKNFLRICE